MKVYGVTTRARVSTLPGIPTLEEQGLKGFEAVVWRGLYAPKGTPPPALNKLGFSLREALRDPEFRSNLAKLGTEPVPENRATPEALRNLLKLEIDKWGAAIRKAGKYAD